MSNPYNLEPRAHGLITLKTTFGDLELELFTKECPKNTKNFVQLCLDGYYNGTVFSRVEKDFIAIGGDHNDLDSELLDLSIAPDEFHQRLRFSRRGLLATANTEKNVNGPKFFFSLGPAPELQNKHTIFGRLMGDSVFYLVDLNECQVDNDLRPISDKKVLQVIVTENPFPDLKPRDDLKEKLARLTSDNRAGKIDEEYLEPKLDIKNSKKLSYYDDSDDDDETSETDNENTVAPKLDPGTETVPSSSDINKKEVTFKEPKVEGELVDTQDQQLAGSDARERKLREIREQIKKLKQKLENESATKIRTLSDRRRESLNAGSSLNSTQDSKADSSRQSNAEDPDSGLQKELRLATKKGRQRERETLELMQQFKKKLKETHRGGQIEGGGADVGASNSKNMIDEDAELELDLADGDDWLHHKFDVRDSSNGLAKDANMRGDDWYSIDDPRNPMVERVDSERARQYRRHKERDKYSHEHDRDGARDQRNRSDYKSSRYDHRHHHHR